MTDWDESDLDKLVYMDVMRCARCGKNHRHLAFYPLTNPSDEFDYFGVCPVLWQPVLMAIEEQDE
mgnify:CR=1 FL=1